MGKFFFDLMTIFLSISVKMFEYIKRASFSCILLILMRKPPVWLKLLRKINKLSNRFFINICKNASKQQKNLVQLYMAQFDEEKNFF